MSVRVASGVSVPRVFKHWRRLVPRGVSRGLVAFVLCSVAYSASAADVREDLDGVLSDRDYQTELPAPPAPSEARPTEVVEPATRTFDALGTLGYFFLICLVAFVVVVLGREILKVIESRRGNVASDGAAAKAGSVPRRPVIDRAAGGDALARADTLAAKGDIPAAIALLLMTGIQALSRRAEAETDASRTSREILGLAPLAPESRAAFGDLIRAQEHAHFAARPADMEMFKRCRGSFERFVAAENRGGAR